MKKSTSIASQKATPNSLEKQSIEVSSSILPPPKDLKEYEEMIPNCGERLMKGWEEERLFRHNRTNQSINLAKKQQNHNIKVDYYGIFLFIFVVCVSIFFFQQGNNVAGLGFLSFPLLWWLKSLISKKSK